MVSANLIKISCLSCSYTENHSKNESSTIYFKILLTYYLKATWNTWL